MKLKNKIATTYNINSDGTKTDKFIMYYDDNGKKNKEFKGTSINNKNICIDQTLTFMEKDIEVAQTRLGVHEETIKDIFNFGIEYSERYINDNIINVHVGYRELDNGNMERITIFYNYGIMKVEEFTDNSYIYPISIKTILSNGVVTKDIFEYDDNGFLIKQSTLLNDKEFNIKEFITKLENFKYIGYK